LNSDCFGEFLQRLSEQYPGHLHLIQIDGARAHTAKKLKIPDNIRLFKQPPYCPEVNVIERVWEELKKKVKWRIYENIEAVENSISEWVQSLSAEKICSLTQWEWLMDGLSVSAIY
jgi:transposase